MVRTANAVLNCGSKPIFADIDYKTRNISLNNIKKCVTNKTIAIIVVHFAGLPLGVSDDMDSSQVLSSRVVRPPPLCGHWPCCSE